jgi:hypothetical protein
MLEQRKVAFDVTARSQGYISGGRELILTSDSLVSTLQHFKPSGAKYSEEDICQIV